MAETIWITPQLSDINDYLVAPQAAALQTASLASGQANPAINIMNDVITETLALIRGCLRNIISAQPGTIPPDLKVHVMALVVERLQGRIPQLALTPGQIKAADVARAYLDKVARGDYPITTPSWFLIPDTVERGAPIAVQSFNRRKTTRHKLRGL